MEILLSELNGQLTNLEDYIYSGQEKFEETINKFKKQLIMNQMNNFIKIICFSFSNLLISFLNNSNYKNIDSYVSLRLSYNPQMIYKVYSFY